MSAVKFGPKRIVHSNPFMDIQHTEAEFGTFRNNYYVVRFGPRGGIVAVQSGNVLLVRQYPYLINKLSSELPGGTIQANESPATGAARECFDATGVICRHLKPLLVYY